jgi:hypothetical protein
VDVTRAVLHDVEAKTKNWIHDGRIPLRFFTPSMNLAVIEQLNWILASRG